jgi:hypothetical protein
MPYFNIIINWLSLNSCVIVLPRILLHVVHGSNCNSSHLASRRLTTTNDCRQCYRSLSDQAVALVPALRLFSLIARCWWIGVGALSYLLHHHECQLLGISFPPRPDHAPPVSLGLPVFTWKAFTLTAAYTSKLLQSFCFFLIEIYFSCGFNTKIW